MTRNWEVPSSETHNLADSKDDAESACKPARDSNGSSDPCDRAAGKIASFKVFPNQDRALWFQQSDLIRRSVTSTLDTCIAEYPRLRIVNLSLAVPRGRLKRCTQARPCRMCQAVNRAEDAGLIVVAAAGNTGPRADTIECPGEARGAITVGATLTAGQNEFFRKHGDLDGRLGSFLQLRLCLSWRRSAALRLSGRHPAARARRLEERSSAPAKPTAQHPRSRGISHRTGTRCFNRPIAPKPSSRRIASYILSTAIRTPNVGQ